MKNIGKQTISPVFARQLIASLLSVVIGSGVAFAQNGIVFTPGNIVVSRSLYVDPGSITAGTTVLPPDCSVVNCPAPATAVVDGTYPFVWNNDTVDGSFGITSKIFLDQMTPAGTLVNSLEVPNSSQNGVPASKDQVVTSFPSKSELALNLSTDGKSLTFMGYLAPVGAIDVSNANTPGAFDPSNPAGTTAYRVVSQIDQHGKIRYTLTNAYSGNNGRAAILNTAANVTYTSGNAGNGGNPQPDGIIAGAGAQIMNAEVKSEVAQNPGAPTPVGSFNLTELGLGADKVGKDTNFRGLTTHNNVLYYTKGSGSNGVNTVYFLDTTGSACVNGIGIPSDSATLPTSGIAYDSSVLQTAGVTPYNMCILKGFPNLLAKSKSGVSFPFGIWFANSTTLYVADEGSGAVGKTVAGFYTPALPATNTTAGLQKWVYNTGLGEWQRAYTLTNGLNLGVPYPVPNSPTGDVYPTGNNSGTGGTGFPW
ncbi:MAG TPA: hypothetical protein VFE02_17570, partial [Candidatus Acidoferrales bacterium]|nr:hypothetical protein [Candidatus Acidoferrales bacterium]